MDVAGSRRVSCYASICYADLIFNVQIHEACSVQVIAFKQQVPCNVKHRINAHGRAGMRETPELPGEEVVTTAKSMNPAYRTLEHRIFICEGGYGMESSLAGTKIYGRYKLAGANGESQDMIRGYNIDARATQKHQAELAKKDPPFQVIYKGKHGDTVASKDPKKAAYQQAAQIKRMKLETSITSHADGSYTVVDVQGTLAPITFEMEKQDAA